MVIVFMMTRARRTWDKIQATSVDVSRPVPLNDLALFRLPVVSSLLIIISFASDFAGSMRRPGHDLCPRREEVTKVNPVAVCVSRLQTGYTILDLYATMSNLETSMHHGVVVMQD